MLISYAASRSKVGLALTAIRADEVTSDVAAVLARLEAVAAGG